ncbi:MAG: hypothetical protein KatS3mg001_166 [Candidatus Pacearchaeota archaeon]|nr:MAG: hypothetical protein KatS3mg001_166 [Candidatus Pacearchaeota archaeon]
MLNTKNIFWEAFIITVAVFLIGIFLGIAYESRNVNKINNYYSLSEISLIDSLAINEVFKNQNDCNVLISGYISFADKIYNEAILLEKYEESSKITDDIKIAHKRYDLLRTILWSNLMNIPKDCRKNFSTVVYLYEYETKDINKKAKQNVWSKVLFELKQDKGDKIILIPIAADSNHSSLNILLERFDIKEFPVVIINEKHKIYDLKSPKEIESYLYS